MTLVDDHVTVLGDTISDDALLDQALNDGDVEDPGRSAWSPTDTTDRLCRDIEERRESVDPLVSQLATMHQY